MLNVTSGFKQAIKKLSVFSDGKVDITNDSGTLSFTSDNLVRIDIFGSAFENGKVLGNLAQHSLTIELLGNVTKDISLNKENIVEAYIGVLVDEVYEYVQYQDFLITEMTYSDTTDSTKIIATDYIIKLNKEFVDENVYPMTLKEYLESVLLYCDLELENVSFLNDDFVVESRPFPNFTGCKEIVSRVAEMALSFAIINKVSNKLEFLDAFKRLPDPTTHNDLSVFTHNQLSAFIHNQLSYAFEEDIDDALKNVYWSFKLKDNNFGSKGINTLVLKMSQVEGENNTVENATNVAIDGAIDVTISDNPFINTEDKRLSVINDMFDAIDEHKFIPFILKYRGFPYLELGDVILVENMGGQDAVFPVHTVDISYDGGLSGDLSADAFNKVSTQFKNTTTLSQRVKTAEIKVDKVEGEVTILAGDYYDGKLVGTYYNFDGVAFTITNSDDEVVFTADNQGNLTLTGTILGSTFISGNVDDRFEFDEVSLRAYKDGEKRVELNYEGMKFIDDTGEDIANVSTYSDINSNYFRLSTSSQNAGVIKAELLMSESSFANGRQISMNVRDTSNVNSYVVSERDDNNGASAYLGASNNVNHFTQISARSNGTIGLSSTSNILFYADNQTYQLFIGGLIRTITRDANGFLKC